jgi:hypothetical protein
VTGGPADRQAQGFMKFSSINLGAGIFILALLFWGILGKPSEQFSPGGPVSGLLGLMFLLGAFFYFLLRRTGFFSRSKGLWSEFHILLGCVGAGLIFIHSGGVYFTWTGLLALSLVLILLLGLNLRFFSGRQSFRNFSSRLYLFTDAVQRGMDLEPILQRKRSLLRDLDSGAAEGVFGLRLKDWLFHPWKAARYLSLVLTEKRCLRKTCGVAPPYLRISQGWGRYLHIIIGAGIMVGIALHLLRACPYFSY